MVAGVATGVQALRFVRIPAEIPGVVSLADGQPRMRRLLENRLGRPATDVALVVANALAQALGQGPIGLVVDIAYRANVVGELQARRDVWERREPEFAQARRVGQSAVAAVARPQRVGTATPLPVAPGMP